MNPFNLDATELMVWGLVAHLIADWLLQNDWMANNKAEWRKPRRSPTGFSVDRGHWFDRHPAAYVHAGIHGLLLALVFGWVALPLALAHLLIDCRWIVAKWSQMIRQTQPSGVWVEGSVANQPARPLRLPAVDIGLFVRFWNDQVWHIACIAAAALVVGS